jgi:hypothetical protein
VDDPNTNASKPTTTTETPTPNADPNPAAGSTDTSTTDQTQPPPSEGDDEPGTLLTPKEGEQAPEQTPEEKAAEEARAAFYGAPEGDYEVKDLPEGMGIDQEALAAVTPVAKELNLSNEGFNKLTSLYATEILPKVQDKVVDGLQQDIAAKHAEWASQSMEMLQNDDMFKGLKLENVQQVAAKALDRFGGTEIREFLDQTGLGNHPAFLKAFFQIGTAISEDTTFERGGPATKPKSSVEKFYGPQ